METQNIKLDDIIIIGEYQARPDHPGIELDELVQSIKTRGLLQPIRVVPSEKFEGKYEIIVGQRRYLAFRQLGLTEIPAIIAERQSDPIEYLIDSCTENTMRRDQTFEETKAVCVKFYRRFHSSVKEIVKHTGFPEGLVRKHITWATLNPTLRQMVDDDIVSLDAAKKAVEVADLEDETPSEETINNLAISLNKLTQSQRIEVKKKKRVNTAVETSKIIEKVENEKQDPKIEISLTHNGFVTLKQFAQANSKTVEEAASEIVEDAMQEQTLTSDDEL